MKHTFTGIALMLILALVTSLDSFSQGKGSTNGPPSWAPAHGYRAKTRHIYFPDQNFYFDLQTNEYIYLNGDTWQVSVKLPSLYAAIDLDGAVKVELELSTDSPQKFNHDHIAQYKVMGKGGQEKLKVDKGGTGKSKVRKK